MNRYIEAERDKFVRAIRLKVGEHFTARVRQSHSTPLSMTVPSLAEEEATGELAADTLRILQGAA